MLFDSKNVLKLAFVSAGAFLLLAPSVKAVNTNLPDSNQSTNIQKPTQSMLLAQSDVCDGRGGSLFVEAETRNFNLYICGGDYPAYYVGIAKNGSGGITLPLSNYSRDRFVARNRDTTYTLTRKQLLVTQRGRTIVREAIRYFN